MTDYPVQRPAASQDATESNQDINNALREMIAVVRVLQSIYEMETEILKSQDGKAFLEFQDRKSDAARAYQSAISTLILRKEEVKAADSALREELKATQNQFSKVIQANMNHLNRMRKCTEKLGQTMRNAAIRAAQEKSTFSYGENGKLKPSANMRRVSSGISETA